jgi:phosphoglycolate phosphatase
MPLPMPPTNSTPLIVFDCDGTLVDSQHGIIAAMESAFRAHNLDIPGARDVRRVVGLPLDAAIERLLPGGVAADINDLVDAYRIASDERRRMDADEEPMFPGVRDVLASLTSSGYALGVATGKSRRGLQETLRRHDLANYFQILKSADDGPGKPHPAILQDAMTETGAAPQATVMIGDTTYDIQMAVNAGSLSIGVSWGYHETDELSATGANSIAQSFHELPLLIARFWE